MRCIKRINIWILEAVATEVYSLLSKGPSQGSTFFRKWSERLMLAKRCLEAGQRRQECQVDQQHRSAPKSRSAPGDKASGNDQLLQIAWGCKTQTCTQYLGPFNILEKFGPANLA
jgi:hypothetical protein